MSEAKHVPGPYQMDYVSSDGIEFPVVVAESTRTRCRRPRIIAELEPASVERIKGGRLRWCRKKDAKEIEATARLFAASPELLALAKAYEDWEAKLILCNEAWKDGMAGFPTLTQELWDDLLELQALRNEAVKKAEGREAEAAYENELGAVRFGSAKRRGKGHPSASPEGPFDSAKSLRTRQRREV